VAAAAAEGDETAASGRSSSPTSYGSLGASASEYETQAIKVKL